MTPAEKACAEHPGRHCDECKATLYVDAPADVAMVCKRAMCPSFNGRDWPEWADSARWWEQKRRSEAVAAAERQAEPIPE